MKVKLNADLETYGKVGDVLNVPQVVGSRLVCQGSAQVVEFDLPPEIPPAAVQRQQATKKKKAKKKARKR